MHDTCVTQMDGVVSDRDTLHLVSVRKKNFQKTMQGRKMSAERRPQSA